MAQIVVAVRTPFLEMNDEDPSATARLAGTEHYLSEVKSECKMDDG
jgi:hypothetical protein